SDIIDYSSYSESEIEDFADLIYKKYATAPERSDNAISEDDILDIKNYLEKFTTAPTDQLRRSSYFDKLARVIRRVPVNELLGVLQYLWHGNSVISELFTRLSATLVRFGYAKEIYTSIEAVRHYGDNKNTFMSVDCLNELDLKEGIRTADIFIREADGKMRKVADVPKCEICALCAETVFLIDKKYLSDTESYACSQPAGENGNMPSESASRLSRSIHKNLLKDMDLLDFPGARSRLKLKSSFLSHTDDESSASNSVQMLLRGKVAYLFNSYNENRSINILLFCHDNEQPAVTDMYNMVDTWVSRYVGINPAKRRATMDLYGGISPLFVVSTKFNIDMTEKEHSEHNSMSALNQRWEGRFEKVLFRQVFKGESVEWLKNWNAPGSFFNNTYMLRDYKYSGCTGSGNNIYEGFSEKDESPEELKLHLSPRFYNDLRESFINNETVRKFFADPALSWDVAASRNNDGALYIIENLTRAASKAENTRCAQFAEIADASSRKLREMMSPFFVDSDDGKLLLENIRKARAIMRELDFTANSDNYFFGHLLQGLMITGTETLSIVHRLVQSTELSATINDWKEYELIRRRCCEFAGCSKPEEKWARLMEVYYFSDQDEADKYLKKKDVDATMLFSGEFKKKSNSHTIAAKTVEHWHKNISSPLFRNTFSSEKGFDSLVLSDLTDCVKSTSKLLGLTEYLQAQIAPYVDIVNVANANENLVADILSSVISDFVADMGYSMLPQKKIDEARETAKEHTLPIFDYIERERKSTYTEDEISEIFSSLKENPSQMTPSFDNQYYKWLEYMYIAFISHVEKPNVNPKANDSLKEILDTIKA
ncbi:MAG: putative virulence factor, partial [Muribaculaceae bacterium]|nr:putative virulence factor [Muribaculaceae bacterium]